MLYAGGAVVLSVAALWLAWMRAPGSVKPPTSRGKSWRHSGTSNLAAAFLSLTT